MNETNVKIALLGNPNSGKSTLFNQLTKLRQRVGNFPGVTVEKKTGQFTLPGNISVELTDFPGCYSLYPNSTDEKIVVQNLLHNEVQNYPDFILFVADSNKLDKHLLLFHQLKDLGFPLMLVLNMIDEAERAGKNIHIEALSKELGVPVVPLNSRSGQGIETLRIRLKELIDKKPAKTHPTGAGFLIPKHLDPLLNEVAKIFPGKGPYELLQFLHHCPWLEFPDKEKLSPLIAQYGFESIKLQIAETFSRLESIKSIAKKSGYYGGTEKVHFTEKMDGILAHRFWGVLVFMVVMLFVFQAIYFWAAYPMDLIEWFFGQTSIAIQNNLPESWITSLLAEGILAGLGGILVFVPQIAILFFLLSILEELGYMARVVFLFDRIMQLFGLNGRSVVALIAGGACAIPAIMSTRTISSWRERLITILVTPFISCSARIPVYTALIGFVVPPIMIAKFFNLQGLAFMGLYLLGILGAFFFALLFKWILPKTESSFLMLELPNYRFPNWRNVGLSVWEKTRSFVLEAGKIILLISIALWFLASYGPADSIEKALSQAEQTAQPGWSENQRQAWIASKKMEASYAGILGKAIEPAISPLGFDWKIGIALITSFAAREVFVGSMATIYSVGSDTDEWSIRERMADEINMETGLPRFDLATSLSLLLFYVFAMQCMSTLAVVKRETNSWKWPAFQFLFMTGFAYLCSFIAFQLFS